MLKSATRFGCSAVRFASTKTTPAYDNMMHSLRADLKHSIRMKNDPLEKNVIKSILTEVKNMEIDSRGQVQDEFKLYDLFSKMIKERQHTADVYLKEGSPDRFKQVGMNEIREAHFLKKYVDRLPLASDKEVDAHVTAIAETLKADGKLNSKQDLFKNIPWKLIKSDWNTSKSAVSESIARVFDEVSDVEN